MGATPRNHHLSRPFHSAADSGMIPSVPLADAPLKGARPGGRLTVAGLPDRTMPNIIRTSAGITLRVTSTPAHPGA